MAMTWQKSYPQRLVNETALSAIPNGPKQTKKLMGNTVVTLSNVPVKSDLPNYTTVTNSYMDM